MTGLDSVMYYTLIPPAVLTNVVEGVMYCSRGSYVLTNAMKLQDM